MSFPFHSSSFSGLCPDSFISRFESFFLSFQFFVLFFFQKGWGIEENLESVITESSFAFTGEQELTWGQDAQAEVSAGHESGQKSSVHQMWWRRFLGRSPWDCGEICQVPSPCRGSRVPRAGECLPAWVSGDQCIELLSTEHEQETAFVI